MNDLIEKLKDKTYVRAFGLMPPEEQEYFRKAGKKNCVASDQSWFAPVVDGSDFFPEGTYAIRPDYRPEKEYVDYEISSRDGWLQAYAPVNKNVLLLQIHKLPSLPNFEGFWRDNNGAEWNLPITNVANNINEGHKVFARFRSKP